MNKNEIGILHQNLITNMSTDEMDSKTLLKWGNQVLKDYKKAKSVIRNLSLDEVEELKHWEFIKNYTWSNMDEILEEISNRSMVDLENFSPQLVIQFADLVSSARYSCWQEIKKDEENYKEEEVVDEIEYF